MESMSTPEQHTSAAGLPVGEGMRHQEHPDPRQLERFLCGQASRDEVRAIVRHLLARCPECLQLTRRIWWFGDRAPRGPR